MKNPLSIGTQGLAPGGTPLQIATQGLLLTIAPAPVEEDFDGGLVPFRHSIMPRRKKQDAIVEVEGCRGSIKVAAGNVAKTMPTTEQLDLDDDRAFLLAVAEQARAELQEAEDERAYRNWNLRFESVRERLAARNKARAFRRQMAELAAQTTPNDFDALVAVCCGLVNEVAALKDRLSEQDKPRRKKSR